MLPVSLLQHSLALPGVAVAFHRSQASIRFEALRSTLASPSVLRPHPALARALDEADAALDAAAAASPLSHVADCVASELLAHLGLHRDCATLDTTDEGRRATRVALLRAQVLAESARLFCGAIGGVAATPAPKSPRTRPSVASIDLFELVRASTGGVTAFCVEKHGAAPVVNVALAPGRRAPTLTCVPSLVGFIYVEMLKNSMSAMLRRYSAAGVDDAPAVEVLVSADSDFAYVTLSDAGGGGVGGPQLAERRPFALFATGSGPTREELDYKYSREFGAAFSGHGLGLARSDAFALLHGGAVELTRTLDGVAARACFLRSGATTDSEALARLL